MRVCVCVCVCMGVHVYVCECMYISKVQMKMLNGSLLF